MADNNYHYLSHLSKQAIHDLARCLARQPVDGIATPSPDWLLNQERLMTGMSKELFRPKGKDLFRPSSIIEKVKITLAEKTNLDSSWIPPAAILCNTHKDLNPCLVRRLFVLVATEGTIRTDKIRKYHGGGAHLFKEDSARLDPVASSDSVQVDHVAVAGFVDRMNAMNGLWIHESMWATFFNPHRNSPRFQRVESCCEACILAVVGGNAQLISDLRACMLSRTRHRTRLGPFVEMWLAEFEKDMTDSIRESSDSLAEMLAAVRKETHRKHRSHSRRKRISTTAMTKQGIPLPRHTTKMAVDLDGRDGGDNGRNSHDYDDGYSGGYSGEEVEFNEYDLAQERGVYGDIMASYLAHLDEAKHGGGRDMFGIHPAFSQVSAIPAPLVDVPHHRTPKHRPTESRRTIPESLDEGVNFYQDIQDMNPYRPDSNHHDGGGACETASTHIQEYIAKYRPTMGIDRKSRHMGVDKPSHNSGSKRSSRRHRDYEDEDEYSSRVAPSSFYGTNAAPLPPTGSSHRYEEERNMRGIHLDEKSYYVPLGIERTFEPMDDSERVGMGVPNQSVLAGESVSQVGPNPRYVDPSTPSRSSRHHHKHGDREDRKSSSHKHHKHHHHHGAVVKSPSSRPDSKALKDASSSHRSSAKPTTPSSSSRPHHRSSKDPKRESRRDRPEPTSSRSHRHGTRETQWPC